MDTYASFPWQWLTRTAQRKRPTGRWGKVPSWTLFPNKAALSLSLSLSEEEEEEEEGHGRNVQRTCVIIVFAGKVSFRTLQANCRVLTATARLHAKSPS